MNKIFEEYLEEYKKDRYSTLQSMKNHYDNEDEYWWIIEDLLDRWVELKQENQELKEKNRQLINNKYDAIYLIQDLACYEQDTHTYCNDIKYYDVQKIVDELEGNNE